jgi:hypothetical protein
MTTVWLDANVILRFLTVDRRDLAEPPPSDSF